ncbi:ABC transporter permease [Maricurvus nonylphenolicus]|uniref:ABC transporter permease n=1 Tax=Maricurvus nonylphenolicus TaxID=1008307 RepID=UPI0036F3FAF2
MFISTFNSIVTQELRILRRDPAPFTVLFVMPALALLLFTPALGAVLREQGHASASGVELALPGMAVMFGSLGAAFLGFAIFREHQWQSWQRLLASPAPITSILLAKMVVPLLLVFGQQLVLLVLAVSVYDITLPSALGSYAITAFSFALNTTALGLLAAACCHSLQQMNAIIHISALLLAATCGAFIPLAQMPEWIQVLSVVTPSYWMVSVQTPVLLNAGELQQVLAANGLLVLQSIVFLALAGLRFRAGERKYNWA